MWHLLAEQVKYFHSYSYSTKETKTKNDFFNDLIGILT